MCAHRWCPKLTLSDPDFVSCAGSRVTAVSKTRARRATSATTFCGVTHDVDTTISQAARARAYALMTSKPGTST